MREESKITRLHREILQGRAGGKTLWQPRIQCWYDDRRFRGEALPGRFQGASSLELYNRLGVSNRLYEFNACMEFSYHPSIRFSRRKLDELTTEEVFETPAGTVRQVLRGNTSNFGVMPVKWWVEDEYDLAVFSYIEDNTTLSFNMDTYKQLLAEWGHLGLPAVYIPRVNMQRLFHDLCGIENAIFLLSDAQEHVEEYFEVLHRSQMRMLDVLCESPLEWVNFGDNIHSKVLSPQLFERYVLPAYQERTERLRRAGIFSYAHFDGDVKELFPFFQACGLDGLEAITPKPQGDVTLREVKDAMGGMMLVDGVAAVLFDEVYPLKQLKQQVEECLHLFEGQLILGISDEMPSTGTLDRVEVVAELVEDFNAKH